MKQLYMIAIGVLCISWSSFAQRTITGLIVDAESEPLVGVNVIVKGTTIGTVSDVDGTYALDVDDNAVYLVYSYTGYETQEISLGLSNIIDLTMAEGVELDEVLVTALGISKDEKAIGYAVSQVNSSEINRAADINPLSSIKGKVAGIDISSANGQPGASSKVRIRGVGSITGSASPLLVIDGVPQFDNFTGVDPDRTGSLDRQVDYGNSLGDLNPNDVESVTVLKGAAASALYGSRAGSGVIIVTTKRANLDQPLRIEYNGSYTRSEVGRLQHTQSIFGQGWSGVHDLNENGSWGPKYDGKNRLWGKVVDNQQQVRSFEYRGDKALRDAFGIGAEFQNSIAFSAGTKSARYRLGFTNTSSDGIIPTDQDSYGRQAISLSGGVKIGKLDINTSINYQRKSQKVVPGGQGDTGGLGSAYVNEIYQIPGDFSILDFQDIDNKFNNLDNYYTSFAQNPFFGLIQNGNQFKSNRTYGNLEFGYNVLSNLKLSARFGGDLTDSNIEEWGAVAKLTPGSNNALLGATENPGAIKESSIYRSSWNVDLLGQYDVSLTEDLSLGVLAGYNIWETRYKLNEARANNLTIPGFYDLNNSPDPVNIFSQDERERALGVYTSLNLGYRNWLYLTLTGRNDWFSTVPLENNSGFFPSASLSAVVSELLPSDDVLSYLKVRASWARVANDADPYLSTSGFDVASIRSGGFGALNLPVGGINGFEIDDGLANANLGLEETTELEFGVDARFFNNRIGVDLTLYDRRTDGQILTADIAASSGFTSQTLNVGELQNKGVEVGIKLVPIQTRNFSWEIDYNFSKNNNEVLSLDEANGISEVTVFGLAGSIDIRARKGTSAAEFFGPVPKRNEAGQIIVNPNTGFPVQADDFESYGSAFHDYSMGITNTFRYKSLALGFTADYRKGGMLYSSTADINYFVGSALETTYNDRNPFVIPNTVIDNGDGTYSDNTTPIEYDDIWSYWNDFSGNESFISRKNVVDRTYFKLRQLHISYDLPKRWLGDIAERASLTLYGRNLLLWTPEENYYIDPESSSFGTGQAGEFGEFYNTPTTRDYGMKLNVVF